jgi:hypothetical protein
MNSAITRRTFVAATSGSCLVLPFALAGKAEANPPGDGSEPSNGPSALPTGFPSHEPALAREVVGKSHSDLDTVKKLVEARPALAKAVWDWGFGDWESALGAASHVGRRDIAELLMAHGARPDIFTFAMFGQLEAVTAIIRANPGIQRMHGPHGITLLAHARAGGEQAAHVVEYLQSLGDADNVATNIPVDPALRTAMIGTYVYEFDGDLGAVAAAPLTCSINDHRAGLAFKHEPDGSARVLFHQGNGHFHPAGAPKVGIMIKDKTLVITDGDMTLRARLTS